MNLFKALFITLSFVICCLPIGKTSYGQEDISIVHNQHRNDLEKFLRKFSAFIIEDKKDPLYFKVLADVTAYPQINFKQSVNDYQLEFDKYILSLLPYMLTKLKQKDLNGEFPMFYEALYLSRNMGQNIVLSPLQEASFNFVSQALMTEKSLRACSKMMSEYQDKKNLIDVQLSRIDVANDKFIASDLIKMKQDLYFLNSNLLGNLYDQQMPNKIQPTNRGRMPASVVMPKR